MMINFNIQAIKILTLKLTSINHYKIAVLLSSASIFFGIFREFLIVGLLGFSAKNDLLQLYLSIFYSIGLMIDAMRLACLNLFSVLPLSRILMAASIVSLPFSIAVGLAMSYATKQLDILILIIAIVGSYLNLIAALLITYKQRHNVFLKAQMINVMPNFILIPGILLCYYLSGDHIVLAMVSCTSLIPVLQCLLLFSLKNASNEVIEKKGISLFASVRVFIRHFAAMVGEQCFQIITRATFYNYGTGYLSAFSMIIRIYAAIRFILIDSFIGSKLASWKKELQAGEFYLSKMLNSTVFGVMIALLALAISLKPKTALLYASFQMIGILVCGFYFSTLVRIVYFKINRHEINPTVVWYFALYEMLFAFFALVLTYELNQPILAILWLGYIAKPFAQLLLLRKQFYRLAAESN